MTPNSNLKSVINWLADIGKTGDAVLADGKVTFLEGLQLLPNVMQIGSLLPKFKPAKNEWIKADAESKEEVEGYIREQFEFANEKLEAKVEAALQAVIQLGTLFE